MSDNKVTRPCESFQAERTSDMSIGIDGREIIESYLSAAAQAERKSSDNSVANQLYHYQKTGETTPGVKALLTVTEAFIDAVRKSCIKKASGLLPSAKAHIVCADASKLVWRNHEPFLCIGNTLVRKFGLVGAPWVKKDIADFVQAALEDSVASGCAHREIAVSCQQFEPRDDYDRWKRFYDLAEAGKFVQVREITLRWGLPDADRLRLRDVWESDVEAYAAGVPLEDIFA